MLGFIARRNTFSGKKRRTLSSLSALSLAPFLPADTHASTIHALPRIALVIGNSAYPTAPLDNPENDASAIGSELKRLGFSVDLQLNATRAAIEKGMRSFCASLGRSKGIGLFYFAGHGLQIDWRNYLVPVDARLDRADKALAQTVEISSLLNGLGEVANPMNIIILDACRDNPFGGEGRTGKGLSQMDAPSGTLLAYATAPGNVASDGRGKNGLYTEHLLKEIGSPETKIEDVLKRVRLAVRRASQGQQIPWESTSLEDDFYFIPPADMRQRSQEELDRLFAQERELWDKARAATEPALLVMYLKTYPSGRFAELAQVTLDRLLARQGEQKIASRNSDQNPFSKGSASFGLPRVGDRYTYRVVDILTQIEVRQYTQRATEVGDDEVIYNKGATVTDLLGNVRKFANGKRSSSSQIFAAEYSLGKHWSTRYDITFPDGKQDTVECELKVVARENVSVPAGTFDTFRVELRGWVMGRGVSIESSYWIAPGRVPRFIAFNELEKNRAGRFSKTDRTELVSFVPGK